MRPIQLRYTMLVCFAAAVAILPQTLLAKTLCVKPGGGGPCFGKIQLAVNAASSYDVIDVASGVYAEEVVIGKPLSLVGSSAEDTIIDASGLGNGIFVDGYHHVGLHDVTVAGFTVKNALYEGVLVVSASDVTIRRNRILNNDLVGPVFGSGANCKGQPAFETDESGDCGGGLHFIGVSTSIAADNFISKNADGILVSDETGLSAGNLLIRNVVTDNPGECGIVLASHAPVGSSPPFFAPHFGIDHNTIAENVASKNGVTVGGAGVGLFSDGAGPGRVSNNVIIRNELTRNGLPGVALHTHVGPVFGAPPDNMDGNMIIGNFISGNGADFGDTATPGTTGININSGGGGSPVRGTVISQNVIRDEEVDLAANTPATIDAHLNDLLGGKIGAADVCKLDNASNPKICTGRIDAIENYWGCHGGPGAKGCSTTGGGNVLWNPWLRHPVANSQEDNANSN